MDNWQSTFLGLKQLPRELTAFEIEAFFTFTLAERQMIEDRRRPTLKLGLALQIGFLRMSGRLLDAVPMVPPALWRHLEPSLRLRRRTWRRLRALYRRAPTLIETYSWSYCRSRYSGRGVPKPRGRWSRCRPSGCLHRQPVPGTRRTTRALSDHRA
jgi:hypothetical protein